MGRKQSSYLKAPVRAAIAAVALWLCACTDGAAIGPPADPGAGPDEAADAAEVAADIFDGCVSDLQCANVADGDCRYGRCVDGGCVVLDAPDHIPCDDGDVCTSATTCSAGVCGGGVVSACDDDNPCTSDTCDPLAGCQNDPVSAKTPCDDGDPCTSSDLCRPDGHCEGSRDSSCTCEQDGDCGLYDDDDLCNGVLVCETGLCRLDPASVVACPPAARCRENICDPASGQCTVVLQRDDTPCDDLNPCSTGDVCASGVCRGETSECACEEDDDCKAFQGTHYDLCLGSLVCADGACEPDAAKAVICEDASGDPCTTRACNPATGLCGSVKAAEGTPCPGEHVCAPVGSCSLGSCVLPPPDCDDDNPCTADECIEDVGCAHEPRDGPCDDGDPCTAEDTCTGGACIGAKAPSCDDGNPCTVDTCDPAEGGCVSSPAEEGTPCGDDNACTANGACVLGECRYIVPIPCATDDPCQEAACDPSVGCQLEPRPDGTVCADPDPCTKDEGKCVAGACVALPRPCGDNNPCTTDSCDPDAGGCVHAPTTEDKPCQPTDLCLHDGICSEGGCVGGEPVVCEDGPCDVRECDPKIGGCKVVEWVHEGEPCDDGDLCTGDGTCIEGSCAGAEAVGCDDGDLCTLDACDPESGACMHDPVICPAEPCALSTCDPATGCGAEPVAACTGTVVLEEGFACDAGVLWIFQTLEGGAVGFAVDGTPDPPAASTGQCSLNFNDGVDYDDAGAPAHALADSPLLDLAAVSADGVDVAISFVEWVDLDGGADTDRRWVALVDDSAGLLAQQELEKPPVGDDPAWTERTVVFFGVAAASARVRFELDTVNAEANGGAGWFVDALVVRASPGSP